MSSPTPSADLAFRLAGAIAPAKAENEHSLSNILIYTLWDSCMVIHCGKKEEEAHLVMSLSF